MQYVRIVNAVNTHYIIMHMHNTDRTPVAVPSTRNWAYSLMSGGTFCEAKTLKWYLIQV